VQVADKKDKKRTKKGIDWSWSELANLVKFSRDPIQASLLKFDDTTEEGKLYNKLALECYQDTMRFMGDYPAKGKSETDIVDKLLLTGIKYPELKDEIYCHIVKQTTNNRSDRTESCARGWRLLVIITAFHRPSEYFEKYLRACVSFP
jgi:myosin-15